MTRLLAAAAVIILAFHHQALAELKPEKDSVHLRVIDTGAGLATLLEIQNDTDGKNGIDKGERYFIVYDTGHWNTEEATAKEIVERIPDGEQIDLLIISHPDSDHLAGTDEIINGFKYDGKEYAGIPVDTVIRTGYQRPDVGSWATMQAAIRQATAKYGTRDVNLKYDKVPHGTKWQFGETTVTLLSGFSEPPADWDLGVSPGSSSTYESRRRNAISIIIRVDYKGRSFLLTGDAVGRKDGPPQDSPSLATEKYLIDNAAARPITADLLVAPHHGSDNGNSKGFIQAVAPKCVIFSAGHDHGHPRKDVVDRYKEFLAPNPLILTTDRGDNDEGKGGWATGSSKDKPGDDGVSFLIAKHQDKWSIRYEQDGGSSGSCD